MIEGAWLAISLFAAIYTVRNWRDAVARRSELAATVESAQLSALRDVMASGTVRRELVRLVSIGGCLVIIIPALLRDGDTSFNVFVVAAMLIPAGLAANSYLDRQMRLHVERLLA